MQCSFLALLLLFSPVFSVIDEYSILSIPVHGDGKMAKVVLTDVIFDVPPSTTSNKKGPSPDCASQRAKSLLKKSSGDALIYIPICSNTNKTLYDAVQCHDSSRYCWCVNVLTGEPIPGSTSLIDKPRCVDTSTKKKKNNKQRCHAKRRQRFLKRLVASLKTEMIMSGNYSDYKPTKDFAIMWKFDQLDKNKNKILERIEWRPYKAVIQQWKRSRRCSRSFFKSCDQDHNKKLTIHEWKSCLAPAIAEVSRVPAKRPDQLNPFLYVLKSE